jgi:hypothetical protein
VIASSATSLECPRQIIQRLGYDLMRILPDDFTLPRTDDLPYRQTALLDQPGTIARPADRFPGVRVEPANAPDRLAPFEMPAYLLRNGQIQVEPIELDVELVQNPARTAIPIEKPRSLKKAGLHPARGMDERRDEPQVHGCFRGVSNRHGLKIRIVGMCESRPSAASANVRREASFVERFSAQHDRLHEVAQYAPTRHGSGAALAIRHPLGNQDRRGYFFAPCQ